MLLHSRYFGRYRYTLFFHVDRMEYILHNTVNKGTNSVNCSDQNILQIMTPIPRFYSANWSKRSKEREGKEGSEVTVWPQGVRADQLVVNKVAPKEY